MVLEKCLRVIYSESQAAERERLWDWFVLLKFKILPPVTHFLQPDPTYSIKIIPSSVSQIVPLPDDQTLKSMSLWGPFLFQPPQKGSSDKPCGCRRADCIKNEYSTQWNYHQLHYYMSWTWILTPVKFSLSIYSLIFTFLTWMIGIKLWIHLIYCEDEDRQYIGKNFKFSFKLFFSLPVKKRDLEDEVYVYASSGSMADSWLLCVRFPSLILCIYTVSIAVALWKCLSK